MHTYLSSRLFLLFPLPLICFTVLTMLLKPETLNYQSVDFVAETLFLGSTHNYLSLGIFLLPATATWLAQRSAAGRHSLGMWSLAMITVLFSFFMWRALTGGQPSAVRPVIIVVTDFLLTAFSLHHTLWQVKGISFTYGAGATTDRQFFKSGHTPYYILLCLAVARPAAYASANLLPGLKETVNFRLLGLFCSLAMISLTLLIALPYFFEKREENKRPARVRGWYTLRLFSWALIPISKYGFIVTLAIHGIEYLFVMLQIYSRESRRFVIKTVVGFLSVAVLFRFGVAQFNAHQPGTSPLMLMVVNAFALTIGVSHYYWDRVLFAMRDVETRQFMGPRLMGTTRD